MSVNGIRQRGDACNLTLFENGVAFGPFHINDATFDDGVRVEMVDQAGQAHPQPDAYAGEAPTIRGNMSPTLLACQVLKRARAKALGDTKYKDYDYAALAEWKFKGGTHTDEFVDAVLYDASRTIPAGTQRSTQNFAISGTLK